MRAPRHDVDGMYVLAAAVIDSAAVDDSRASMRALAPKPGARLHWRHENPKRRAAALALVVEVCPLHVVVAGGPMEAARQERARGNERQSLLQILDGQGKVLASYQYAGGELSVPLSAGKQRVTVEKSDVHCVAEAGV